MKTGEPVPGVREIPAADLALVKVRYKAPDASEADPAAEIAAHLTSDEVITTLAGADADMQWAAGVAAFAEILKNSPFANRAALANIAAIVEAQKTRDERRAEFATLFTRAQPLLTR